MSKFVNNVTKIETLEVYDIEYHGCITHKKDIMVSTSLQYKDHNEEEQEEYIDIFLTLKEAYTFQKELEEKIKHTEKYISQILEMNKEGQSPNQIARNVFKDVKFIKHILKRFEPQTEKG